MVFWHAPDATGNARFALARHYPDAFAGRHGHLIGVVSSPGYVSNLPVGKVRGRFRYSAGCPLSLAFSLGTRNQRTLYYARPRIVEACTYVKYHGPSARRPKDASTLSVLYGIVTATAGGMGKTRPCRRGRAVVRNATNTRITRTRPASRCRIVSLRHREFGSGGRMDGAS